MAGSRISPISRLSDTGFPSLCREEADLQPRSVVKVSLIAFSVLLVGLIAYASWWMRESNHAIEEVSRAAEISNAYRDALQAITDSQVTVMEFMKTPTPELQREFDQQVFRAAAAIGFIQANGNEADQALVLDIYQTFAPRLPEVSRTMDMTIAGSSEGNPEFPPEALISELRARLTGPEYQRRLHATSKLTDYQTAQKRQTAVVVGGLVLGLPLLGGLLVLIRVFERRETVANLNMERLELAALTDSLTSLGNHRAYQEELHAAVEHALSSRTSLSLAVIDVDEFKEVNDTSGHARGDQILFQLGRLLREACGVNDRRFRVGGDEFAVILPGSSEASAHDLMERFRSLASLTGATVSIGVAHLEPGDDTEILREKADSTLYTAKRRGRNTVCTFSGDNAEQKVVTQSKIKALRDLIREDTINVVFQAVHASSDGSIMGFESLARVPKGFDLEGPQEAFDIAERIGRAGDLDYLCIREALRSAHSLAQDQILFLNLSPRTIDNAGFSAGALEGMVLDAGLLPSQVCFEITERSTAPIDIVEREVDALRTIGFKIALDDVGAGNSGLEMMRRLRVDYVKIDSSVMVGAMERGSGRAVLLAIIVFASEAGAIVIAEGIETPEMLEMIRETNAGPFAVQGLQGYILGRPARGLSTQSDLPLTA